MTAQWLAADSVVHQRGRCDHAGPRAGTWRSSSPASAPGSTGSCVPSSEASTGRAASTRRARCDGRSTRRRSSRSVACRCWALYALQRLQGWLPLNPQGFAAVSAHSAFNTAASFTTNTNWQGYAGESTMSYLTQMAGLGVPELRVGGSRHRAGGRLHPRHRPPRAGDDRQFLGGHDTGAALDPPAGMRRGCPGVRVAGSRPEPEAVRRRDGARTARRPSPRARSPRRRRSSSSAPTAAASSTRTAPTPSRIRRRRRISWRCSSSLSFPRGSPGRSAT